MPGNDLLPNIFTNTRLPLAVQFTRWVQELPRFREFAEIYRDKIRKKVRGIAEHDGYSDLQAELATAHFLTLERRFLVEMRSTAWASSVGQTSRSPTRPTSVSMSKSAGCVGARPAHPEPGKLVNTLCAKLAQLPPGMINLLMLTADDMPYSADDLAGVVRVMQERAEHKDDVYFTRRGPSRRTRLSQALQPPQRHSPRHPRCAAHSPASGRKALAHPLPPDLANILQR